MQPNEPTIPPPNAPVPENNPVPAPQPQPEPETPAPAEPAPSPLAQQFNPPANAPTTPAGQQQAVPDNWPGGFGVYKYSKQAVRLNIVPILGWAIIIGLVTTLLEAWLKRPGQAVGYIVGSLGTAIATYLYISGVRQQKVAFNDAFMQGLKVWLNMFILTFLVMLTVVGSLLLLIIPALFIVPRLALANYFLVDKRMNPLEAYKASWHATKGNVKRVYGIFGAGLAMVLLMVTIVGIPFAIYFLIMYSAATAVLYEMVLKQQPAANTAVPTPAPKEPVVS